MKKQSLNTNDNKIIEIIDMFDSVSLENSLSLYFHIPFCTRRCSYCNYVSSEKKDDLIEPYFEKLMIEIERFKTELTGKRIRSIYIGGGTPSLVNAKLIEKVLQKVKSINNYENDNPEITIELNPETVTKEKLEIYKRAGINRLSIGLQSANCHLLEMVNRFVTIEMFEQAMKLIKEVGFFNFSVDIMIGLPNQTLKDVKNTLSLVLKHNPPHISVYSLILEKDTALSNLVIQKKLNLPSETFVIKAYEYILKTLTQKNLLFYEIGNFAKIGFESIHNINYWFHGNFLGLGAGAFGLIDSYDYLTSEDIEGFSNGLIQCEKQLKSLEEIQTEKIMLGLRTIFGIPLSLIKPAVLPFLKTLLDAKFLKLKNNRIIATKKGFYVLNKIILNLI